METWYFQLVKPDWAPPAWVFGPVWGVLYVIIVITYGYAAWLFFIKKIRVTTTIMQNGLPIPNVPHILWVSFATILQLTITILNRGT